MRFSNLHRVLVVHSVDDHASIVCIWSYKLTFVAESEHFYSPCLIPNDNFDDFVADTENAEL